MVIIGGASGVGSSVALNLLLRGELDDVVLVDINPNMIASHVMDLEQTLALGAASSVRRCDVVEALDSDVVVVSASAPLRLNSSRLVFLNDNAAIVNGISDLLIKAGSDWDGVLLIVTNPVDQLCTWEQRRTGLDRRRILGYTPNDGLRLRTGIGQVLGAAPQNIDAWVIGEHGDFCVPLFSRVKLNGDSVDLTAEQRKKAEEFMRSWYVRHVALGSCRFSTWTTGLGVARMVAAIVYRREDLWPASVVLAGEYGIDGVSLGVPVSLGRHGAEQIHEWRITSEERAALQVAATHVREATNAINLSI
ncbi:MAG: malate dehydrogenase [Acidobacteria bacterium]|nr:malate dehydrogenase [Acidobacteriota bacterium]